MGIKEEALDLQDNIVSWRRMFHMCPELKMDTPITSGKIVEILQEIGIKEIRTGVGGNGVSAVIYGAREGKCLGIRADCDGLPIREETGLFFASQNGNMHACGHDTHVSMALGAAKLIYQHKSELCGSVKFIFQPYEEGVGGARAMIVDGVMEDPHVDAMIALHTGVVGAKGTKSGDLSYHPIASSFASNPFRICVQGKSSHAAMPHMGNDPLLTACYIVVELQALLSRETEPGKQVVLSVNMIHGGNRNNIIPQNIYMEGTLRAENKETIKCYFERLQSICCNVAESMRCKVQVESISYMGASVNHPKMTEILLRTAPDIVGKDHIFRMDSVTPANEDFALYAELVPSVYFFLSAAFGDERDFPHHNSHFHIDESNLWKGSGVFADFALNWQNEDMGR